VRRKIESRSECESKGLEIQAMWEVLAGFFIHYVGRYSGASSIDIKQSYDWVHDVLLCPISARYLFDFLTPSWLPLTTQA
jgi:hypothetical protein